MLWMGKPLEEYSKGELVVIIETLARMMQAATARHQKDMEVLVG